MPHLKIRSTEHKKVPIENCHNILCKYFFPLSLIFLTNFGPDHNYQIFINFQNVNPLNTSFCDDNTNFYLKKTKQNKKKTQKLKYCLGTKHKWENCFLIITVWDMPMISNDIEMYALLFFV